MSVADNVIDEIQAEAKSLADAICSFASKWKERKSEIESEATPVQLQQIHAAINVVEDAFNDFDL